MTRIKTFQLFGLGMMLMLTGLAAFLLARTTNGTENAVAQNPVLPEGTPPTTDANRIFDEDWAKPDFVGTLNGFRFYDPSNESPQPIKRCSKVRDATKAEIAASKTDFEVTYMPQGLKLVNETASFCDDHVGEIWRMYAGQGDDHRQVFIKRTIGMQPVVAKDAPADRLSAATLVGRPSVIQRPVIPRDRSSIFMRDDESIWGVSGFNLDLDGLVKIAEGLQ